MSRDCGPVVPRFRSDAGPRLRRVRAFTSLLLPQLTLQQLLSRRGLMTVCINERAFLRQRSGACASIEGSTVFQQHRCASRLDADVWLACCRCATDIDSRVW
jgi:hypothetical protein